MITNKYKFVLVPNISNSKKPDEKNELNSNIENMVIQALDGFLLVLSEEGDVTYVSENLSEFLGILQLLILLKKV